MLNIDTVTRIYAIIELSILTELCFDKEVTIFTTYSIIVIIITFYSVIY